MSDLIGFEYSKRNPVEAAYDFCHNLTNIADFLGDDINTSVVSIILDGENAWEYFPDNARVFLDNLYSCLCESQRLNLKTFSECTELPAYNIKSLCAGSWVYGSFSTWIGQSEKNHAWDLLVHAKQEFDKFVASNTDTALLAQAEQQLAICESSDWFWWFGDYNPGSSIKSFDNLYRKQLKKLYQIIASPVPPALDQPINRPYQGGEFVENAGIMRRGQS